MTSLRKSRPAIRSRTSRRRLPTVQPLEARDLLSAISVVDNGTLTIEADDRPNQIGVWNNAETGALVVQVDDTKLEFRSAAVSHIQIFGNGGDDRIGVRDSVTQTTRIEGGNGNDWIVGSRQNDVLIGGRGDDRIQGGDGNDWLEGGTGDDGLSGGNGSDVVFAGQGDDRVRGGRGVDYLIGGSGNDEIDGGAGDDWIFGDATNEYPAGYVDPVTYAIDFANTNRGRDALSGGSGNDIVLGGNSADRISGGDGNDLLIGGAGADRIGGGDGNDGILGDWRFRPSDMPDDVMAALVGGREAVARLVAVDPVEPDQVDLRGNFDDQLYGGNGNDVIFGMQGDDLIRGGDGRDALFGGAGQDVMIGGAGSDYFNGGAGHDSIHARDGEVDTIFTDGFDRIVADDNDEIIIP